MLIDVGVGPEPSELGVQANLRSFAQLFEEQRPGALRLAYAMTGDAQLAEDVVAESFARVYERWVKGALQDPDAYVRSAVVNQVRTVWRRLAVRRRHAATRRVESAPPQGTDRVADVDRLQRALAVLSPRVRAVVILRIVDDLSEQRTAEVLGCSVGTVKSYLSRGLERLRADLTSAEGDFHG